MVEFYVEQIIKYGRLTIDDVPKLWREKVRKAIEERRNGESGNEV